MSSFAWSGLPVVHDFYKDTISGCSNWGQIFWGQTVFKLFSTIQTIQLFCTSVYPHGKAVRRTPAPWSISQTKWHSPHKEARECLVQRYSFSAHLFHFTFWPPGFHWFKQDHYSEELPPPGDGETSNAYKTEKHLQINQPGLDYLTTLLEKYFAETPKLQV